MAGAVTLYYEQDGIAIYHEDARDFCVAGHPHLFFDVMLTDPPYGIGYESGRFGTLPRSIVGDKDTSTRDEILMWWGDNPALVFGSWRAPRPVGTRALLVWDTLGANGMGALDLPWKPSHQEIYVLGHGFVGKRTTDVLRFPPVQSMARNGRVHPHEKPLPLLSYLLSKCPGGLVLDPFMGSGSTLVAAKVVGRSAIGVEIDERYCEVAAKRLAQGVLL
jgi:DNA modification methylase